jgi:hypothetical protein
MDFNMCQSYIFKNRNSTKSDMGGQSLFQECLTFNVCLMFNSILMIFAGLWKQERITFHRGANLILRLILEGLGRSTIIDESTKVSWAQETRLIDLSKGLFDLLTCMTWMICLTWMTCMNLMTWMPCKMCMTWMNLI